MRVGDRGLGELVDLCASRTWEETTDYREGCLPVPLVTSLALMKYLRMVHVDYTVTKSEFKRCELCGRPSVGTAAEKLRKQMENSSESRSLPGGPNCIKDRETGLWQILAELQLREARATASSLK